MDNIKNTIAAMDISDYVFYGALAIFLLFGLIGLIKGIRNGVSREVIRTVLLGADGVVSFFLAKYVYNRLIAEIGAMSPADIKAKVDSISFISSKFDTSIIAELDTATIQSLTAVIMVTVVLPIIFVLGFIILSIIVSILHKILCFIFGLRKKRNNGVTRLLGAILGACEGIAVAAVITLPIFGIGSLMGDVVTELNNEAPEDQTAVVMNDIYSGYVKDTVESPVFSPVEKFFMIPVYNALSTVNVAGKEINLPKEVATDTVMIYGDITVVMGQDWKNINEDGQLAIADIINRIDSNEIFAQLITDCANKVTNIFDMESLTANMDKSFSPVINELFDLLKTTSRTTLKGDLDTLTKAFFILSDKGVLIAAEQDNNALIEALTGKDENGNTAVGLAINTLNENDRTKGIVTALSKVAVNMMSGDLVYHEGFDIEESYESIKSGLNDTVAIDKDSFETEEEYVAAVSESIDTTLRDNGIELKKETVDSLAEYVNDNKLYEMEEVTDEDIQNILLQYYEIYKDQLGDLVPPKN